MSIPLNTAKIIDDTDVTSGTQALASADEMHVHRVYATISAAATVTIQASPDSGTTWFDLGNLTETGVLELDRPWPRLRVSWAGNTGDLSAWEEHTYDADKATV